MSSPDGGGPGDGQPLGLPESFRVGPRNRLWGLRGLWLFSWEQAAQSVPPGGSGAVVMWLHLQHLKDLSDRSA